MPTQAIENENKIVHQAGPFIFPAENDPHEATILGFPSRCSISSQYLSVCAFRG
jgi:hypothetical protein